MKARYAAERFFAQTSLSTVGVWLLFLRLGFAYTTYVIFRELHAMFPALQQAALRSSAPFGELLGLGVFSSFSYILLLIACTGIAVGAFTRLWGLVMALWVLVALPLAFSVLVSVYGSWFFLWTALCGMVCTTGWGRVWGIDDVLCRIMPSSSRLLRLMISDDAL